MSKKCDYPGCNKEATIRCSTIGCTHQTCDVHGNGAIEVTPEETAAICWQCDGKGWKAEEDQYARH